MSEQQNIEYKSNWHDDYLKWVCGFANAQGGRIYIGVDDVGKVVDLEDYKRLMDEIPNKIKNNLGITAEVNLLQENDKHSIEIIVQPYSVPISLRGRYYYRSGSVKQELTGTALNEFLLKRAGHTWDDVVEEDASFDDIDEVSIKKYLRKADETGRLPDIDGLSTPELLEKLHLTKNGKLKRAAIVLFGKDPGRFYPNTFVKIGKFEDHSSHPRNPILAGACFLGGYIDSWGSGIMKIINSCKVAGLPTPDLKEKEGGFIVTLYKDKFSEEQLQRLGLNDRQIKAVLYMKDRGKITNSEYQTLNNVSKRTSTNDLSELVENYNLLNNIGFGAGSYYELSIGQ